MREDTRKRLERALWADRAKKAGLGLAILAAIGAVFAYENFDLAVTNTRVAGVIDGLAPLVSKTSATDGVNVDVKLDDGRHVHVIADKKRDPHVGERIEITEHRHATGRVTHTLK